MCPDEYLVVPEPAVRLDRVTELAPDLVVVHLDEVGGAKFTVPPLLVVEVRSPSTALIDLNRKKAVYEKFGLTRRTGSWTPNRPGPSSPSSNCAPAVYVLEATSTQPLTLSHPFSVSITPADSSPRACPLTEPDGVEGRTASLAIVLRRRRMTTPLPPTTTQRAPRRARATRPKPPTRHKPLPKRTNSCFKCF